MKKRLNLFYKIIALFLLMGFLMVKVHPLDLKTTSKQIANIEKKSWEQRRIEKLIIQEMKTRYNIDVTVVDYKKPHAPFLDVPRTWDTVALKSQPDFQFIVKTEGVWFPKVAEDGYQEKIKIETKRANLNHQLNLIGPEIEKLGYKKDGDKWLGELQGETLFKREFVLTLSSEKVLKGKENYLSEVNSLTELNKLLYETKISVLGIKIKDRNGNQLNVPIYFFSPQKMAEALQKIPDNQ